MRTAAPLSKRTANRVAFTPWNAGALILASARGRLKSLEAAPGSDLPLWVGFSMAGSTSFGWMTPFDLFSFSLRFWADAPGVVSP
jgi:hypothetical protein